MVRFIGIMLMALMPHNESTVTIMEDICFYWSVCSVHPVLGSFIQVICVILL
jgi:hypothetical protein